MTALKQIDSNIKRIITNAQKVNELIHETGVMVLEHALAHGDCSRAQTLVMAMPASMRRTMLIAWFGEFSPIVVKNSDDWNAKMQKEKLESGAANPLYKPFNIEAARELPFWQMAEQEREADREPLSFEDLVKMVERLATRIERDVENNRIKPADVESAKAVARTLEGLHFTRIKKAAKAKAANKNTKGNGKAKVSEELAAA